MVFIRNPAEFERFSNERDFRLLAIKENKNDHELSFGFIREVYYGLNSDLNSDIYFWLLTPSKMKDSFMSKKLSWTQKLQNNYLYEK